MDRLIVIDGNSLLFRAYYAMRPMVTKDGVYTQGVYAFLTMLRKIRRDYEPSHLAVCFDVRGGTFRHESYPEYKAGRQKTPPELLAQVPVLHRVLEAMNIPIYELQGYEADDLIGTITLAASREGLEALVITGDKDELQLIDERTKVIINRRGMTEFDYYDCAAMEERYGLTPAQFIDLKGLMGDSSDHIPGVPGIGEKKGIALLAEYGTLEEVLDHAEEIRGKMGESIREHRDMAVLSKKLATICREAPISFTLQDLRVRRPDDEALAAIYRELEFSSFLRHREAEQAKAGEIASSGESTASGKSVDPYRELSVEAFYAAVPAGAAVAFLCESDGNHRALPELKKIAMLSPEKGVYAVKAVTALNTEAALQEIAAQDYRLIGSRLQEVVYAFLCYGVSGISIAEDIEIAEYLLDPNRSRYPLDKLLLKYTSYAYDPEAGERTRLAWICSIAAAQHPRLEQNGLLPVYRDCELPLIEAMAAMECAGITVDREILLEAGAELEKRLHTLEAEIHEAAGEPFNIQSPKQLGRVLFEELGIPYPGKPKGKNGYSTAADILEKLQQDYPIVRKVLAYRKAAKLKSTYIDGLLPLIGSDGRIHPHFRQTVAATGRISCTEPNLQNIPVRDPYGRNIRKAFVVSDAEHIFVAADYSQIELRILAAFSGDEQLIRDFREGADIHRRTAARVFDIPFDEVMPLDRSRAKAVNFGVIYGMSGFGLSEELMISRGEAQQYIDEYFEKHAAVKAYLDEQIACGERDHAVRTLLGRLRQIPEFSSRKYSDRQLAQRLAMNTPIQGSAADIIKLAMNRVYRELRERQLRSRLILQIHDELIIEAAREEYEEVRALLKRNMEQAAELAVPLVSDIHSGATWYELK